MSTTTASPPALSRYRSLRRPQQSPPPEIRNAHPTVPQIPTNHVSPTTSPRQKTDMSRSKSMSRYHNRAPVKLSPAAIASGVAPHQPVSPTSPPYGPPMDLVTRSKSVDTPRRQPSRYNKGARPPLPTMSPPNTLQTQGRQQHRDLSGGSCPPAFGHSSRSPTASNPTNAHAEALELLQREKSRQDRMRKLQQEEQRQKKLERDLKQAEHDKIKARKDEEERLAKIKEREEAQIAQAEKDEADLWRNKRKEEAEKKKTREKMEKLKAKAEAVDDPISHPQLFEKLGLFRRKQSLPENRAVNLEPPRPFTSAGKGERQIIKPGGGGIVPLSDAPVSAVNHGDRRVRIVTQGKSVLLPIKNTSTPLQLIRSCVTFLDVPIDPRNSLLMEDFSKCGIQRSLRMYEHIRNVLNSWDSDDQHTLTLIPYDSSQDSKLYATWSPKSRPSGGRWSMYMSQERGKWDKRVITMSSDGQISAAKNEDGKGLSNICHLSDFEVYSLSRDGEKKKVKPPKKFCYAIKSLQKSSMFLGETGFIHMFCSSDAAVAQSFYDTIYRWRCWYLVHVMGEDGGTKELLTSNAAAASGPLLSQGDSTEQKRSSHYVLGSFNNDLKLDFQTFEVREAPKHKHKRLPSDTPLANTIAVSANNEFGLMSASEHSKAIHARQQSIRRAAQSNPTMSSSNPSKSHSRNVSNNTSGSKTDTSLQHTSSQNSGLQRNASVRSTTKGQSINHSQSTRHRQNPSTSNTTPAAPPAGFLPKPLIDLRPAYVEPPQHRGKGRGVQANADGPLVESATTQREPGAIVIPESQSWRRRNDESTSQQQNPIGVAAAAAAAAATNQRGDGSHGLVTAAGGPHTAAPVVLTGLLAQSGSVKNQSSAQKQKMLSATYGSTGATGVTTTSGGGRGLIGELPGNEGFTGSGLLAQHVSKD